MITVEMSGFESAHMSIPDALDDAFDRANRNPQLVVTMKDTEKPEWSTKITQSGLRADELIREHRECEIVDYESRDVTCYSCSTTVKWIG